jgi:photosystem II stability/assembly factor-like uncharacterized protein
MRRLATLLLLILFLCPAYATWTSQTSPTTQALYAVQALNSTTALALGHLLVILKTTDGTNWTVKNPEAALNSAYYAVSFPSASTGYAAGTFLQSDPDTSLIAKTLDGGENWSSPITNPGGAGINDIFFINENIGWLTGPTSAGNAVLKKTENGGSSWASKTTGLGNDGYYGLHFINSNNGCVVGNLSGLSSGIYYTTNGGDNWTAASISVGYVGNQLRDVFFANPNIGWAVGTDGGILKTTDGGANWTVKVGGPENHLNAVHFINEYFGYAVGEFGTVKKSIDGGETWTVVSGFPVGITLNDVYFKDAFHGWIVGGGSSVIYKFGISPTAYPSQRPQGWNGDVAITGGDHFRPDLGPANVTFSRAGAPVNSVAVNSVIVNLDRTQLLLNITISPTAPEGSYDITITDPGGGNVTATGGFTVSLPPTITSVTRNHPILGPVSWDRQGAVREITINGANFQSGAFIVFSGSGVSASLTTFVNSSQLKATMSIAESATVGLRDAVITNPDFGSGTLNNAFEFRQNTVGPTISDVIMEGKDANKLTLLNPAVTGNLADPTGLSPATVNLKILIDTDNNTDTIEYFQDYPSTCYSEISTTQGTFKYVFQSIKKFDTQAESDAYKSLKALTFTPIFYAEDMDGNPARLLGDAVSFSISFPAKTPVVILPSPNKNPTPANPGKIQIDSKDFSGPAEINIIGAGMGLTAKITGVNLNPGNNTVTFDGQNFIQELLPNGIYLVTVTNPVSGMLGKGKLVIFRPRQ